MLQARGFAKHRDVRRDIELQGAWLLTFVRWLDQRAGGHDSLTHIDRLWQRHPCRLDMPHVEDAGEELCQSIPIAFGTGQDAQLRLRCEGAVSHDRRTQLMIDMGDELIF